MELYTLRHAKAEERSARHDDDSQRALTKEGIKRQRDVSHGMKALELEFDLILSSPFARAKLTAEIVADVLDTRQPSFSKHLAAGGDLRSLIEELKERHSSCRSILLV